MRNIPFFTTDAGVAGLVLEEIPYKKQAYITLLQSDQPGRLLQECADFCRMAGAEHIYATGHAYLENFPLHTVIWQMSCNRDKLPPAKAKRVPLKEGTLEIWRKIYNERMAAVPNSATMTVSAAQKLLQSGDGYFVYRDDVLIGIGKAKADTVESIISLIPGCGAEVLLSLCSVLTGDKVVVEVASENFAAVKLYRTLGFEVDTEVSRWFRIEKDFLVSGKNT